MPFWSASGTSDCGMATGVAPRTFITSAPVPEERSGMFFRSARVATGFAVITTAGGHVKAVRTWTSLNSAGCRSFSKSASTRLAVFPSGKKCGRSTASLTGNRPGW